MKKEKLILISPSGKQFEIGFLNSCTDGIVVGTTQIENVPNSHLTIIEKDGEISSHITPQNRLSKRQCFPPMTTKDFKIRAKTFLEQKVDTPLSEADLSEQVIYVTQKLANSFNALMDAIYYQEISKKEIAHFIDLKNGLKALPKFFKALKHSPEDYFGMCQVSDLLNDKTKIAGVTNSRKILLQVEDSLVRIDLFAFLYAEVNSSIVSNQDSNPLSEMYKNLGLSQYVQEIVKKGYFEKIFVNDEENKAEFEKLKKKLEKS